MRLADRVHWIDLKRDWRGIVTFQICVLTDRDSLINFLSRFDWGQGYLNLAQTSRKGTSPHRARVLVLAQQFPHLSCACEGLRKATTGLYVGTNHP